MSEVCSTDDPHYGFCPPKARVGCGRFHWYPKRAVCVALLPKQCKGEEDELA